MDEKLQRTCGDSLDNKRLKALLDEKTSDFEKTKYELDVLNDQHCNLRKEADDLRKKLEDYEKVAKVQRNISADSAALEKELKQLKSKYVLDQIDSVLLKSIINL
jgi:predicted  nucleic acid-binding Zn-ribbon protein